MRLRAPRRADASAGRARIEADVVFEDAARPPQTVYVEATAPLAEHLEPLPEAFVLAALPAALWLGERRLRIEGPLDPTLAEGLAQATSLFGSWHDRLRPLALEPEGGTRPLVPARTAHHAALCSGGVDALCLLRTNRQAFPPDHPGSIRTAVHLFGSTTYDFVDGVPSPPHVAANDRQAERLAAFCGEIGLALARVWTNAVTLYPDATAYMDVGCAATPLAVLIACPGLVTDAHIGSSGFGAAPVAHGSHPALDPLFSTSATGVRLGQPFLTRHQKIGRLADWAPAYGVLHPCHHYLDLPPGQVNCGSCEKCVRTMLSLVAWGALDRFTAFPVRDVPPATVDALRLDYDVVRARFWSAELLGGLEAAGRQDLAEAVRRRVARATEGRWRRLRRKWARSARKRLGLPRR